MLLCIMNNKDTKEITNREDFRDRLTVAIDPATAKDFDDAISFKTLSNGNYEVGIHIADVSHYVKPNSLIDKEARKKTTSTYLVGNVDHMLPSSLSEHECSLREGEDKLTFSTVFELSPNAEIVKTHFAKTIVNVDYGLSYEKAQAILDHKMDQGTPGPLVEALEALMQLSKHIRTRRTQRGAIAFHTTEVEFDFNADGEVIGARAKEYLPTMGMIEDFMLLANEAVAQYISEKCKDKQNCIGIYRVHDKPDMEKIEELNVFLRAIGHPLKINKDGTVNPHSINKVLSAVKTSEYEKVVNTAILRTMAKAIYTSNNIGHFSLGFRDYTHFTSPIRRYPDIITHRILWSLLSGNTLPKHELEEYRALAQKSTEKEIEAVKAERASIKSALTLLMTDKIGQTFTGEITGVTDFGIFVSEQETRAEGMVHISKLPGADFYELDAKHFQLVGKRTGNKFQIGQKVKIKLIKADIETSQIDWQIIV